MTDTTGYTERYEGAGAASAAGNEDGVFVVLLFLGLHTAVSVLSGETMIVPYVVSLLAALILLSLNLNRVGDEVVQWFLLLAGFMVISGVLATATQGSPFGHLKGSAQLLYSALIGYAAYLGLTAMGRERVELVFFWVALIMLIGALLEVLGPLRPLSDWFRDIFNAWYGAYNSDFRDMLEYGAVRPKLFASEPSILALMYGLALFLWLSAKKKFSPADAIVAAAFIGFGMYLIRSPNLLFGPIAAVFVCLLNWSGARGLRRLTVLALYAGFAFAMLLPALSLFATITFVNTPHYMKTLSYFERIEAPFLVAIETMLHNPLAGIGFGDAEQMRQVSMKVFNDVGLLALQSKNTVNELGRLVGNLFWEYWIRLGVIGGVCFALLLNRLFKVLEIRLSGVLALLIAAITFWQGFGGLNAPLAWFTIFAIAALSKLRQQPEIATVKPPSTLAEPA